MLGGSKATPSNNTCCSQPHTTMYENKDLRQLYQCYTVMEFVIIQISFSKLYIMKQTVLTIV